MWGNYLSKAKALAETIDKQVNEAVGIPNEATTSAPASGAVGANALTDKLQTNSSNGNEGDMMMMDDGWNDDFDDDDDDDDVDLKNENHNAATVTTSVANTKPPLESHISRGDSEIVTFDETNTSTENDDNNNNVDDAPQKSMFDDFDDNTNNDISQQQQQQQLEEVAKDCTKEDYHYQQEEMEPVATSLMAAPTEDTNVVGGGEWDQDEEEMDFDDVDMSSNHEQQEDEEEAVVDEDIPPPQLAPEEPLPVEPRKEEEEEEKQKEVNHFYKQEDHPVLAYESAASTPVEDIPEPPSPRNLHEDDNGIVENEHHFFQNEEEQPVKEHEEEPEEPKEKIVQSLVPAETGGEIMVEESLSKPPIPPLLEKTVEEEIAEISSPPVDESETVEPPSSHPPHTQDGNKSSFFVPQDKTPSPTVHDTGDNGINVKAAVEEEQILKDRVVDAGWEDEMYLDDDDDGDEGDDDGNNDVEREADTKEVVVQESVSQSQNQNMEIPTTNDNGIAVAAESTNNMVNRDEILKLQEEHQLAMNMMQSQVHELQQLVAQRENQLASKAEQFTTMQNMLESEKEELRTKVRETKEEAKKRIGKAKERVQDMEKRYAAITSQVEDAGEQQGIITALREEGEKLARKQSEMEKAVRSARGETRELRAFLEQEEEAKLKALDKIASLEGELKRTKDDLASARKGESLSGKLESDLATAREESELKAAMNLTLEQEVKELKAEKKELKQELEEAKKEAEKEKAHASKLLKREHSELLSDLEMKLRTSEREANVREDALRHEVNELRKRWQDAVRRADALSMDVQNSTAPLMRQLESTERQNRARAATWAELETKLRSDLEEYVIQNEKIIKDRNELRANANRLQRLSKDTEEELEAAKVTNESQFTKIKHLEAKLLEMETEGRKMQEEWVEVEKLANEGVAKVRSEMTKTIVDSEERYRSQIAGLEKELEDEREKRRDFEEQMEDLAANVGVNFAPKHASTRGPAQTQEKKLKSTQNQADILASTLGDLDSDYEDEVSVDDEPTPSAGGFAAMEQLTQRLKASTEELKTLRKELEESEKSRESLVSELAETRQAREKLPLFEAKVEELMAECREKEFEIRGLQDDIVEVKTMYRSQLDILLEEKASEQALQINGDNAVSSSKMTPEGEARDSADSDS